MPANSELLVRTMRHIDSNPDLHDQEYWARSVDDPTTNVDLNACGTAMCFAGWAVLLHNGTTPNRFFRWNRVESKRGYEFEWVADATTTGAEIEEEARKLLGLDSETAERLFDGANLIEDLREIVTDLTDGAYRAVNEDELADA